MPSNIPAIFTFSTLSFYDYIIEEGKKVILGYVLVYVRTGTSIHEINTGVIVRYQLSHRFAANFNVY